MKKLFLLIFLLLPVSVFAATWYASPSGSGTACSSGSPCTPEYAIDTKSSAGDTIYLQDGTYNCGSDINMCIDVSTSGSAGNYKTIKAVNDGEVTINGGSNNTPIAINSGSSYIIVEGINAHSSSDYVVYVNGSNNIIRRVVAWDAYDSTSSNYHVFLSHNGTDNLFEDVAGWGRGRKIFALQGDTRTTFRRCFFRHTGYNSTYSTWQVGLTIGYYSDSTLIENCIGTWDSTGGNTSETYSIYGDDGGGATGTIKMFGNIGYLLSGQTENISFLLTNGSSYDTVNGKDNVMYNEGSILNTFYYNKSAESCDYCTAIGGSGDGFSGSGTITNELTDPTIETLGGNILQYNSTSRPSSGAWVRYRYVDGVLTSTPLFPWPMEQRIADAMTESGYDIQGGIDGSNNTSVLDTVFGLYGGTIPTELSYECNDGKDNDSDGYIDYPDDSGCSSATDNTEGGNATTLTITEPSGQTVAPGSFDITYDLYDPDDVVTVDFCYGASSITNCTGQTVISECQDQPEGTGTTCSWDTSGLSDGTYRVCGTTSTGEGNTCSGTLTIYSGSTTLTINQPDGVGDSVTMGDQYTINYDFDNPTDVGLVDFYWDTNSSGLDGTAISGCQDLSEGTGATCVWTTSGVPSGQIWVYGITDDGVSDYSSGALTVNDVAPPAPSINASGRFDWR